MKIRQIDKQTIARSFGRAAQSYDSAAHFQRWVGEKLLTLVPECDAEVLVDLGCGTGYFESQLRSQFNAGQYFGLDLSEDMLRFCSEGNKGCWFAGDAENIPLKDNAIDVVFSSLAIQWCSDLDQLFSEINRILKPGGRFVFATLLDGTLHELKQAWGEADSSEQHVNEFFEDVDYERAVSGAGLSVECFEQATHKLWYQRVNQLTKELKQLGAHNITSDRPKHVTGKQRLIAFKNAYEKFRNNNDELPASYEVLFGVLRKEAS